MTDLKPRLQALEEQAIKEAEIAAQKVIDSYSLKMEELIKSELPDGEKISQGNGIANHINRDGKLIATGRGWGINALGEDDEFLSYLGHLQYSPTLSTNFNINL